MIHSIVISRWEMKLWERGNDWFAIKNFVFHSPTGFKCLIILTLSQECFISLSQTGHTEIIARQLHSSYNRRDEEEETSPEREPEGILLKIFIYVLISFESGQPFFQVIFIHSPRCPSQSNRVPGQLPCTYSRLAGREPKYYQSTKSK